MSEAQTRRILIPVTIAILLGYYLFFVWPSLRLYFDSDDMMNLYFAWSKPILQSYRPLGALFYRTMFALAGFNPLPFRIFCLILGLVNMALCYWFASLVTASNRIAALAVLLFAFHSRMMEVWYRTAVIYDLLCFTFFYLAACLYMSRSRLSIARGIAIIACFILALEAKEIAVVLPVILLVWNVMQRRHASAREIVSPESAEFLSDRLFNETLRNLDPSKPRIVVFTAECKGAGKTNAIVADPDLSGSNNSLVHRIETARSAGNHVHIMFVHRDPIEALTAGLLPRAMSEGRAVDLDAHARIYRDASEHFACLMRKYAKVTGVFFRVIDTSHGLLGNRPVKFGTAAQIRYSTNELRPRLLAALESEYAARRISESVYRATLGASPAKASGGVPRDPGAKATPGSLSVSLAIPLLCVLIDMPYLWFKTHGAGALTAIADYQPEYTFTRFAHTWALYLNYLSLRDNKIMPWMAIAILAGLLIAAARSRKLLFAWTILFVPVLPVAFLAYRGAFVLYTSYPGWTLYAAIVLVTLQDLVKIHRTALACLVFALAGWRWGKFNLHDQRADPRTWLYERPTQIHQMASEMKALDPALPKGARCLFLNDPFGAGEWTPYFVMKLLYRDDTLVPDRIEMMNKKTPDLNTYQYVFTYENAKYHRLKP